MEYNKVAAKWWADKLRNVRPGNFDMGEKGDAGFFAMMLGSMLAMNTQSSGETIDLFEERLAEAIKEQVETRGSMTLSVDYGPDYILGSIAQETGVSTNGFPWKTTMWIEKNKVSVSAGYAAPSETIFPIESTEK
jgi:hypothetical protein